MTVLIGTSGNDTLTGGTGADFIDARDGNDTIFGAGGSDTINTGAGSDVIGVDGDPFDGGSVSAAGRQVIGNEDFITDFNFLSDAYQFDAADFGITGGLSLQSLDGNAPGAFVRAGVNTVVLLNSDNDANAATAFNAGTAANQVASLVSTDGAGFFVYFNSSLNVNRLVYSSNLNDSTADLKIVSRQTDLLSTAAINALNNFTSINFRLSGESLTGTANADVLNGFGGVDTIDGGDGNDTLTGRGGQDTVTTGSGSDVIAYQGEAFDGINVTAAGRQVAGNEDFITDFNFTSDAYQFDAADFGITSALSFQSLDGNAVGAAVRPGANVVVLLNADNDANTATAFNAGAAANQVATLTNTDGAGFFVYFNTTLNVNRLVYSSNLNDANADLKIVSRHVDLTGSAATGVLDDFVASNFRFSGESLAGSAGADVLVGAGGVDTIMASDGNDIIFGRGAADSIQTGNGKDVIVVDGPVFDGIDVSAAGRQVAGAEDSIVDFDFSRDTYQFDASDFGLSGPVSLQAVDGLAAGATVPVGTNVVVLLNSDSDSDPNTAPLLNAGLAANQVASLVTTDGAGFFVYFNTSLNVNRLVWSSNLNDPTADLKVISRHTDLTGSAAINALSLFTADNFRFGESLAGTAAADTLSGTAGGDVVFAREGDDTLSGRGGDDTLDGGAGTDTVSYLSATSAVRVRLDQGQATLDGEGGTDDLANIENVTGSDFDDTLFGDALGNSLSGGLGRDILIGQAGNDTIRGGSGAANEVYGGQGDDLFVVEATGETVVELAAEGIDTVQTGLDRFRLAANLENLAYTGTSDFIGIGNAEANMITGGTGRDVLMGLDGNDVLSAGAGAANEVHGGRGNDRYIVQVAGDTLIELANEGTDTVETALSSYSLRENFENLTFTGTSGFAGTGNAADNVLTGAGGDDTLNGAGGNDRLVGGAGNDVAVLSGLQADYAFSNASGDLQVTDSVVGRDGIDLLSGVESVRFADGSVALVSSLLPAPMVDLSAKDQDILSASGLIDDDFLLGTIEPILFIADPVIDLLGDVGLDANDLFSATTAFDGTVATTGLFDLTEANDWI